MENKASGKALKPLRTFFLSVVVLLSIAAVALPLSWYLRRRAYESSYSEIRVGDSEQDVVALYGKPSETSDCSEFRQHNSLEKIKRDCVKVYWYNHSWSNGSSFLIRTID